MVRVFNKLELSRTVVSSYVGAPCTYQNCGGTRNMRMKQKSRKGTYRCSKCKMVSNKFYDSIESYKQVMRKVHLSDYTPEFLKEQEKQISTYLKQEE